MNDGQSLTKLFYVVDLYVFIGSGHRVIPMSAPGVAARKTPCGESETFQKSMFAERLHAIFAAGRGKTATFGEQRTPDVLVNTDEEDGNFTEHESAE